MNAVIYPLRRGYRFLRDDVFVLPSRTIVFLFALGLLLFCATLMMNVVALHVVRKYREQYE